MSSQSREVNGVHRQDLPCCVVQGMLRSVTSRMDHAYEKLHTDCGAWTCVRLLGVDDDQVSKIDFVTSVHS